MSLKRYRDQQRRIKSAEAIFANYPVPEWAPEVMRLAIILINPRSSHLDSALSAMRAAPFFIETRDNENNRIVIAEFECFDSQLPSYKEAIRATGGWKSVYYYKDRKRLDDMELSDIYRKLFCSQDLFTG